MSRTSPTPPEHSLPARAGHKLRAAERREEDAVRLRAEAAELQQRWAAYKRSLAG